MTRSRPRSVRLAVAALEDRAVPAATFNYDHTTRTLTLFPAEGDQLTVSTLPNHATSFIRVTDAGANVIFSSDPPGKRTPVVRNIVARFNTVNAGTLTLDPTVRLGGSLTVFGAKQTQTVISEAVYGGGVFYHGTGAADDTVRLGAATQVGGKVDLRLGNGTNIARLQGGFVGGSVEVTGGQGEDQIYLLVGGDLYVHGKMALNLGDGKNLVQANGANVLDVRRSFTYQGGINSDTVYLRDVDGNQADATLRAGGDVVFKLDTNPASAGANDVQLNDVWAGGDLAFNGGGGADTVKIGGLLTVGNDVQAKLGNGQNYLDPNLNVVAGGRIGRRYEYTGGADEDQVWLDGFTVGGQVNVNLGSAPVAADQYFRAGSYAADQIYGKLTVKAGVNGADTVVLHRLYLANGMDVQLGGGADLLRIDDVDVSGKTIVDMGDGNDTVSVERIANDFGGALGGATTFGGLVTMKGGLGDDEFHLGDADPTSLLQFGPRVQIQGDDGTDTLTVGPSTTFLADGNLDTCENGDSL